MAKQRGNGKWKTNLRRQQYHRFRSRRCLMDRCLFHAKNFEAPLRPEGNSTMTHQLCLNIWRPAPKPSSSRDCFQQNTPSANNIKKHRTSAAAVAKGGAPTSRARIEVSIVAATRSGPKSLGWILVVTNKSRRVKGAPEGSKMRCSSSGPFPSPGGSCGSVERFKARPTSSSRYHS